MLDDYLYVERGIERNAQARKDVEAIPCYRLLDHRISWMAMR